MAASFLTGAESSMRNACYFAWTSHLHSFYASNIHLSHINFIIPARVDLSRSFVTIPTLIALLQLMFEDSGKNPFSTHPNAMGLLLCSLLIHFLACSGQLTFSVSRHCILWSANAAVASVFAPDSCTPLLYVVSVLISSTEFLRWLHQRILYRPPTRCYVARFFSRMVPNSFFRQPQILPR